MTKNNIALLGIGEIGGVFAKGLLKTGHALTPVLRGEDPAACYPPDQLPDGVLITTGEQDWRPAVADCPTHWNDRIMLVQNELLPTDWLPAGLDQPTVISIWFEKKAGREVKVIRSSPAFGPQAHRLCAALEALNIPANELESASELLFELVVKNLYILTANICGLRTQGTTGDLWQHRQSFALEVADEILRIQGLLARQSMMNRKEELFEAMGHAFMADPEHQCTGRSALQRLDRTLQHADRFKLNSAVLRRLRRQHELGKL